MLPLRIIFITVPPKKAEALTKQIIEENLAACVHLLPTLESYFKWEGKLNTEEESLLIVKTTEQKVEKLITFVKENHPYEVPDIIAIPLSEGLPDYLDWVRDSVK